MSDTFLIEYVRGVWHSLRQRLGGHGRIAIFGAGTHTRWLLSVTNSVPGPTVTYILDDDPQVATIADVLVCHTLQANLDDFDLVLISSDRWEDRLYQRARSLWGHRVEIMRLYDEVPGGPYNKCRDKKIVLERVALDKPSQAFKSKQVVLICDLPRSREAKIGYALRRSGLDVVLLSHQAPLFDASRYFMQSHRWSNEWEALRIAQDYAPLVCHLMVNTDYRWAEVFLTHKPGTTVLDSYDLVDGMYSPEFLEKKPDFVDQIERERFCFSAADGLCCRHHEHEILEEILETRLPGNTVFLDGCWNRGAISKPTRSDGSIHIAFVGHLHDESKVHDGFAAYGCNRLIAEAITEQGIHLHIFPFGVSADGSSLSGRSLASSAELISPYFHVHQVLPPDELIEALSQYDFGLAAYPEHVIPTEATWGLTTDKLENCVSNKYFDYIDAGMPVLHTVSPSSFQGKLLSAFNIGINVRDWPISEWGKRLRKLNMNQLRANVDRARNAYDVRRQSDSLIDFYSKLHACPGHDIMRHATQQKENSDANSRSDHQSTLI